MVNTWNSYIKVSTDGRLFIPAGYMHKTEANIAYKPNVLITMGSSKVKAVQRLHRQGHKIVFHTSRDNDCKKVTARWLKKHGFPFHHLECEKFVAHVYIDDRSVNGCDWKKVMPEIRKPSLPGTLARKKGML
jgi:hypothetical protein